MATQAVQSSTNPPFDKTSEELTEELVRDLMASIEPQFSAMTNEERTQLVSDIEAINDRSGAAPAR